MGGGVRTMAFNAAAAVNHAAARDVDKPSQHNAVASGAVAQRQPRDEATRKLLPAEMVTN
jgi:hypothetical protein